MDSMLMDMLSGLYVNIDFHILTFANLLQVSEDITILYNLIFIIYFLQKRTSAKSVSKRDRLSSDIGLCGIALINLFFYTVSYWQQSQIRNVMPSPKPFTVVLFVRKCGFFMPELRVRVPSFSGVRYNIGGIRAFLHFSFCVKLKIETQNTF